MIALSFDIEEFDTPTEYGAAISAERQMEISREGTITVLDLLQKHQTKASFFCTAHFAETHPELIRRMTDEGHEVASHGYYHSWFTNEHLLASRRKLEEITEQAVSGYRMARMMLVNEEEIAKAGYTYNSSLHPTFMPGRYNHLRARRDIHEKSGVVQIPASVTPWLRIPLFWLSAHHFPQWIYRTLAHRTLRRDGHLVIYFHPWEFYELKTMPELKLPYLITHNSGKKLTRRLDAFIAYFKKRGYAFVKTKQLCGMQEVNEK